MLGAISPLSAGSVGGPVVSARVLGVFPTAVYLGVPTPDGDVVVPVVTSDALLLPTAVRLPASSAEVSWGVSIGDVVRVGGGRVGLLSLGGIRVVREWRPARVRRRSPAVPYAECSPATAVAAAHAHAQAATARLVGVRIGRGAGLTPEGDDELCGALLVAHALSMGSNPLRDSVLRVLARTTSLSASLLRAAGVGYAVPELAAYVDAVLSRDLPQVASPLSPDLPEVASLRAAVAAIGHSSGPALLRGVDLGLDLFTTAATAPHSTQESACA